MPPENLHGESQCQNTLERIEEKIDALSKSLEPIYSCPVKQKDKFFAEKSKKTSGKFEYAIFVSVGAVVHFGEVIASLFKKS